MALYKRRYDFCGWVRFQAIGGLPGRLIAQAAGAGIPLWQTARTETALVACCAAADYPRLRPLARRSGARLQLLERHGAIFFLRRYHARPGLLVGVTVYAALLAFLSTRIWSLDYRGVRNADRAAIEELLQAHQVAVGAPASGVRSQRIRLDVFSDLQDVSWLAVNVDGCIAEVEVLEMNPEETPKEPTAPSNLVAARDGVIEAVKVTEGQAAVKAGDAVAKDGLLASGVIPLEGQTLLRRSAGSVIAKTTRVFICTVPLREQRLLPAAPPAYMPTLQFFGLSVPLYDSSVPVQEGRVEESAHRAAIGGVTLPIGLVLRRQTPLSPQTVARTPQQAQIWAQFLLAQQMAAELEGVQVLSQTVESAADEAAVTLTARCVCRENIAVEIPIQTDCQESN